MESQTGLPIFSGPADTLRYGFHHMEAEMTAPHPVQTLERKSAELELNAKLERVRRTYGIHMAMRIGTEESVFGRKRRLPGLPSSTALYDTITNKGERIEFKDFLDDPLTRATAPTVNFHRQTEIQHGLP